MHISAYTYVAWIEAAQHPMQTLTSIEHQTRLPVQNNGRELAGHTSGSQPPDTCCGVLVLCTAANEGTIGHAKGRDDGTRFAQWKKNMQLVLGYNMDDARSVSLLYTLHFKQQPVYDDEFSICTELQVS